MLSGVSNLYAPVAGSSLAIDQIGTEQFIVSGYNANPGITLGGTANELIVMLMCDNPGSTTMTTMTWNGVALTLKAQDVAAGSQIWELKNPATGVHNLNVAWTGGTGKIFIVAVSLKGSVGGVVNTAFANSVTTVTLTSAAGHYGFCTGAGNTSPGLINTQIYEDHVNGAVVNAWAEYGLSSGSTLVMGGSSSMGYICAVDVS